MTFAELETKWRSRFDEWRALGVAVAGEKIAAEALDDLQSIAASQDDTLFTPTQASTVTGYGPESIARPMGGLSDCA
jgi:hypothetical protein